MRKILKPFLLILTFWCLAENSYAGCPWIYVDSMLPYSFEKTLVNIGIGSESNMRQYGDCVLTISLHTDGYPDKITTLEGSYNIGQGGSCIVSFTAFTGCDFTISIDFGCGISSTDFSTRNSVNYSLCTELTELPEPVAIASLSSTSVKVTGSFPGHKGYIHQYMYLIYRKKGSPENPSRKFMGERNVQYFQEPGWISDFCNYISTYWIETENGRPETTLAGLEPGTEYEVFLEQEQFWAPPPYCSNGYVEGECMDLSRDGNVSNTMISVSTPVAFRTLGLCGDSKAGDYISPEINDDTAIVEDFYMETIYDSNVVRKSATKHHFVAKKVILNPGFNTEISNEGGFIASGFNFDDCATTTATTAKKSDSKKSIIDNSIVSDFKIMEKQRSKISIEEPKIKFDLYPNPTTGIVNFHFDKADVILKQIYILDTSGKSVLTSDNNISSIDISHLPNGLYVYKVETNQGSSSGKLIKQ